ncbi:MAG: TIR domain-containing protein [Pseudonocardia sp.]
MFISYAGSDRTDVAKLVKRLEDDGFSVWFDVDRMEGGPPVLGQIADAIADSARTVVCLSDTYLEREWTAFELQSSMHRDPSSRSARMILVRLRPTMQNLPNFVRHLPVCDLTDKINYDREYRRIKSAIERPFEEAAEPVDIDDLQQVCEAPFRHPKEPHVALFLMRRATESLSKLLYRRKIGEIPRGATFDRIIGDLVADGKLPAHLNTSLAIMQMYGDFVVRDQIDDFLISNESIEPALSGLRNLIEWTFPGRRPHDPLASVLESLPRAGPGDLLLPGTRYSIHAEQVSRNGLGPLFAGRDRDRDVSVSVNLVNISEDREAAFFEEVSRFIRLRNANILSPLETGRVVVDGRRRCLYLITPRLDGVSVQHIIEHAGPLPARAAYEVGIGIAQALVAFHASDPPIVHGDIKPANVLVSSIGAVRVLCIGREPVTMPGTSSDKIDSFLFSSAEQRTGASLTPSTDFSALHSVLSFLLSGEYRQQNATAELTQQDAPQQAHVLRRIADCDSAAAAVLVLEEALASLPSTPSLGTVNRKLRRDIGIGPAVSRGPRPANQDLALVGVGRIESRGVWPAGDGQMLLWERGTDTLAIIDGSDVVWRDSRPVTVRRVVCGAGDQLAVGGWDGAVRYIVNGQVVAAADFDGTVGDLAFVPAGVVAGSWKDELRLLPKAGDTVELLRVPQGVHRITAARGTDRFAVAGLAGGLATYVSRARDSHSPALGSVTDLAYAGSRLVVLIGRTLVGVGMDGSTTPAEERPGALRLLPLQVPGRCLLLAEATDATGATGLEAWLIDQDDRHERLAVLPAGYGLLAACGMPNRFLLTGRDGGCLYWRDGDERRSWPDAFAASISADGRLITVSRPGLVELYEDVT